MADILNISELGSLEIIEIYDYYDQPILFACKNATGHLHLVVAADENDQYETWLYVRVSAERLNLIRSGTIDLHDAFADSENGHLFQVKFYYNNPTLPQIEHLESNQIPEDMFPTPGECLDLETEMPPVLSNTEPMSESFCRKINGDDKDMNKKLKVFITYAHKNAEAKDKLITHLAVMKQNGLIDVWHDNEILPGDKWRDEIFNNLSDSDILLYLTCPYSLASVNCNKELTAALNPNIRVIPIILEHCDWENHQLSDFQALPKNGNPIYDTDEWNPESKGWMSVVEGLRKIIDEMQPQANHSPSVTPQEIEILASLAFDQGNFMMTLGQIDEAFKKYSRAIDLNSDFAEAYSNRGIAYHNKGEVDKAMEDFNTAIKLNPNLAETYMNCGNIYHNKGEVDRAIENYNTAIKLKPDYAEVYHNRGNIYRDRSQVDLAIENYNTAIKLKPNLAEAYHTRGLAYHAKGEVDRAIEDYTKAIELKSDYANTYHARGFAYHNKGEVDRAIEDYTRAIDLKSGYAEAYHTRGLAYHNKGEVDKAMEDYNTGIKLKSDYAETYYNRGNIYRGRSQVGLAIEDYTRAIDLKPDYAEAYNARGLAYHAKGEVDKAIEDYTKAIDLIPHYAEAYHNRGTAYHAKGEADKVFKDWNKALELSRDYADAYINRGIASFHTDKVFNKGVRVEFKDGRFQIDEPD